VAALLKWARLNFTDREFLEQQIFAYDKTNSYRLLYLAFQSLSKDALLELLDEVENWREVLGDVLFEKLILMKDDHNQTFLFYYSRNRYFNTDLLIDALDRLKMKFDDFLSKFIFHTNPDDKKFLDYFCVFCKFDFLKFLKWFHLSFGNDDFKKLLLSKDAFQTTALYYFFTNERNSVSSGLEILNYLKNYFDEIFIKNELILRENEFHENILQQIFFRFENFNEFMDLIVNELKISDQDLKASLIATDTILYYISQMSDDNQEKALNFIKIKFGDDILDELFTKESLNAICSEHLRFTDFIKNITKYFDFIESIRSLDHLKRLICFKYKVSHTFLFALRRLIRALARI
jgi:hypothetical protein